MKKYMRFCAEVAFEMRAGIPSQSGQLSVYFLSIPSPEWGNEKPQFSQNLKCSLKASVNDGLSVK
jgi:hypothetical protein